MNNPVPILMYHSISDDNIKLSVKVKSFYSQMNLMKKMGYQSISLSDLNNPNIKNKFLITFDDGYENVYKNAFPILKFFKFKAICFVVTNLIGDVNKWDINKKKFDNLPLMKNDQILKWIDNGFEIGCHTMDHKNMTLIDDQELRKQIIISKKFIEDNYKVKVASFSYPYGHYNEKVLKMVKENFNFAVTTKRSRYYSNKFNQYEIPRVPINANTGLLKFFIKIKTFYEDIKYKN